VAKRAAVKVAGKAVKGARKVDVDLKDREHDLKEKQQMSVDNYTDRK
jgi:hypothetical protein